MTSSARPRRHVRLVYPHQLFADHLEAPEGTTFVLVEDDLFFRQYSFHAQKLVVHRASMARFAERLRASGFVVEIVQSLARRSSGEGLHAILTRLRPDRVTVYDVVDDWLARDTTAVLDSVGFRLSRDDVLESPNFLTSRAQIHGFFGGKRARMASFYSWQRERLDILVDDGKPVGGQWSFDTDNRKGCRGV